MNIMKSATLVILVLALALSPLPFANANAEGDILASWKAVLADPNNVLQSWDPTLINPCGTWFHVTCNSHNSVTRLDLGIAGLSGPLIPQLGMLANLQYLEVYDNNLTGSIPPQLGNLKRLVSLDLYGNRLSGPIPSSLGNLQFLRFLRLNNNKLSGKLPNSIIQLIVHGKLEILDVSNNHLAGTVRATNETGYAITTVIQDPKAPNA